MAIKAGQILHDVHGFVIDRIQTGGAGNLNIPEEKIYELGNFQTVATIRDIPDLSFELESLDMSTETEAVLTDVNPTTTVDGQAFDFTNNCPIHVISPFKSATGAFDAVKGVIVPYLTLESMTARFGVKANSTVSYTLKGDSIYYVPGSPYYQEFAAAGTGPYTLAHTALPFVDGITTHYVLGLFFVFSDGTYQRLFRGTDYTDTATNFTLTTAAPAGSVLKACYGSATIATYSQAVHQDTSVKPAAIRGKDIDVYVGTNAATPVFSRWSGVQSFEITRSVTLDRDEELGNSQAVSQDYDVADVTGTITLRPRTTAELFARIHEISDVPSNEVVGTQTSVTLPVEVRVSDPDTGDRLKTYYVSDARFQVPPIQGRVQQKLETPFAFTSDGGNLKVYQGER